MSRTDAILEAVRVIVEARRAELDAAQDLRALTIAIKIAPGRWRPRLAVLQLEREMVFTESEKR